MILRYKLKKEDSRMYTILSKTEVVPNVHKMVLKAPDIAENAKPGQFVILMIEEEGERLPFTLSDWDEKEGTITIYFLEVGLSTMQLVRFKGDALYAVIGPLGKPTSVKKYGTVVVGGGCYGIGGIYPIAKAMKKAGNKVITIVEARSEYLVYHKEELKSVSDKFIIATSDGTSGEKGKVHDVIKKMIKNKEKIDQAYFIGCLFMMMNCFNITRPSDITTFVGLNPIMVDGTGMCGCCRCSVDGKTKFACVDGPVFEAKEVDWDQLFKRNASYSQQEAMIFQFHSCETKEEV
jgi:ferredoxin--NADP+ reductase